MDGKTKRNLMRRDMNSFFFFSKVCNEGDGAE